MLEYIAFDVFLTYGALYLHGCFSRFVKAFTLKLHTLKLENMLFQFVKTPSYVRLSEMYYEVVFSVDKFDFLRLSYVTSKGKI